MIAYITMVLIAYLVSVDRSATQELGFLQGELRAQKATLRDLMPPPVPDAENGAMLFKDAGQLAKGGSPDADLKLAAVSMNEADVRAYLEKNREALEKLRQAVEKPKCRFDVEYSQIGLGKMLTTLAVFREFTRLLAWDAFYARHQGDLSGAVRSCRTLWRIRPCVPEGGIVCLLVGMGLDYQALNVTRQVIDQIELPQELCQSLVAELESKQISHARLIRCVKMERAVCERLWEELQDADVARFGWPQLGRFPVLAGAISVVVMPFRKQNHAATLRFMVRYLEAIESPWPQRLTAFDVDAELNALPFHARATRESLEMLGRLAEFDAEHTARVDLALLGVGLKLFKAKRGDYPNRLSELAPECLARLPADPFTGQPYRYARKGEGFVAYSVGKNQVDNGGVEDLKNP
ncbi:MAG: hypothetical protein FJ279_36825, partial [Planctomycetes bacterium]|nr:hypothetical protein [Planctomycetota bacterium]